MTCWFSMFTKLASLRGDALLSSPHAARLQHLRTLLLLGGILAQHLSWVAAFLRSAPRVQGALLRCGGQGGRIRCCSRLSRCGPPPAG